MIDLILEVFGQLALDQARKEQRGATPSPTIPLKDTPRLRSLERDHERLKLITMALWDILTEKLGVDEDELRRRILELDRLDGREDGRLRLREPPRNCDACGRPMLRSALSCPYCGETGKEPPLFR
jgi:hypothetical protein